MWQSSSDDILIQCEAPTLTGGVPSEWVEQCLTAPDSLGFIGERDTLGAAVVLEAAARRSLMKYVDPGEESGLEDFELDSRLENREDLREHAVVFAETTR